MHNVQWVLQRKLENEIVYIFREIMLTLIPLSFKVKLLELTAWKTRIFTDVGCVTTNKNEHIYLIFLSNSLLAT